MRISIQRQHGVYLEFFVENSCVDGLAQFFVLSLSLLLASGPNDAHGQLDGLHVRGLYLVHDLVDLQFQVPDVNIYDHLLMDGIVILAVLLLLARHVFLVDVRLDILACSCH